ncbi:hypothetical protein ScPMuIL_009069 [Solemya velum]
MGGSGSTRRIVVENNEGSEGVVKISESVVNRLKGEPDKQAPATFQPPSPKEYKFGKTTEAKEIEAYYQQKLKHLEERNMQLQKTTTEQFAKAVEEVEKKFLKETGSPVCQDLQQSVYECYLYNPKETLKCSSQVRDFSRCVERSKQNAMTRRG